MKSLTKIILVTGIGLLTLLPLSLEAQKKPNYFKKNNINNCISGKDRAVASDYVKVGDTYCSSSEGKHYNKNVYTKSENGKPFFLSKSARNYNRDVHDKIKGDRNSCVKNEYAKYHVNLHKMTGLRER